MEKRKLLTDQEFCYLTSWTHKTKLDSLIDICYVSDNEMGFFDFEENELIEDEESDKNGFISLQDGFNILLDAVVYPFEHEGFTDKDSEILYNLFEEFTGKDLRYLRNPIIA